MFSINSLIILTHIPKTAGSSFRKSIIKANVPEEKIYRYGGLKNFTIDMLAKNYSVVVGHVPYGIHCFTTKKVKYITFLREPVDRLISYYYFLRSSNAGLYGNPQLLDYANSVSLKEFAINRNLHNIQTRFTAGLLSHKLYPFIDSPSFSKTVFNTAINNLENHYFGIGILEYYDESVAYLQDKLGWRGEKQISQVAARRNSEKPDCLELDNDTLQALKQANDLDLKLYSYAIKYLLSQTR